MISHHCATFLINLSGTCIQRLVENAKTWFYPFFTERLPSETLAEHVGRVLGVVGPSMLLSSVSESTCFFLGALSPMPAVKAFALYSGMALLFDFFMQITCFVSLIALDAARQEDNRFDVACCIRASKKAGDSSSKATGEGQEGTLYKLFKYFYAPFLMKVGSHKQSNMDCPLYFI